jgi:hypothetical protein
MSRVVSEFALVPVGTRLWTAGDAALRLRIILSRVIISWCPAPNGVGLLHSRQKSTFCRE